MIVIAGPNGSGKTSVTQRFLHHEWAEGTTIINDFYPTYFRIEQTCADIQTSKR